MIFGWYLAELTFFLDVTSFYICNIIRWSFRAVELFKSQLYVGK
jgi:hypothetical protein